MKIREYITKISENGNIEDMKKLADMLTEVIYEMKDSHPDMYDKYKMKLYTMAYGNVLTNEMADNIVDKMKPTGKKWTIEETTAVKNKYGITDISDVDFFVVMNSAYNDYKDIFQENVDMYVKYAVDFIKDEDAKKDKVFIYYTTIV